MHVSVFIQRWRLKPCVSAHWKAHCPILRRFQQDILQLGTKTESSKPTGFILTQDIYNIDRVYINLSVTEIIALKGLRYAIMHEPSKGDRINEGIMKQLTSGLDPIQARAPFMINAIRFIPQFKLIVCANYLLEIKSMDHGT